MDYEIEMVDDLMTLIDADGHGCDAFIVDPAHPWDAVETLLAWGREYQLSAVDSLHELRQHLDGCC